MCGRVCLHVVMHIYINGSVFNLIKPSQRTFHYMLKRKYYLRLQSETIRRSPALN